MGRRTVVLLGALAVAVVLGILAGTVVRLGGRVKDSATNEAPATFSATQTGFVPVSPSPVSPSPVSPGPVSANSTLQPAVATSPSTTSGAAPSSSPAAPTMPPTSTSPAAVPVQTPSPATTISVQATTRTVGGGSGPDTPEQTPVTTPTTASPSTSGPVGAPTPDAQCAEFGGRADPADSATLYCQHDPRDGVLRWRAVVAGGGCLSKTMTGVDDAGVHYRCRSAGHGQNHWVATR